jgi:ribonuclease J
MVLELAKKHGRSVAVLGRSMLNVIAHARTLGYIKCDDDLFVPLNAINKLPDNNVLILTTGSQGEPMAALTRIAKQEHRQIKIRPGDTVVFSANPIPGNTIAVVNTIDKIMMQGAKVVYGREKGIHVSGHGAQEDQKLMLGLTRPKFFLPVHGEHRMLVKHSETAQSMGIPAENMVIIDNGDVVELTTDQIRVIDKVPSGIELVDSSRAGIVHDRVLKERQQLAADGIITVATAIGWNGELIAKPEVRLQGVVTALEKAKLDQEVTQAIELVITNRWSELTQTVGGEIEVDWVRLQTEIELELRRAMRRTLQSNPSVVVLLQTPIEKPVPVAATGRRTRSTAKVAS